MPPPPTVITELTSKYVFQMTHNVDTFESLKYPNDHWDKMFDNTNPQFEITLIVTDRVTGEIIYSAVATFYCSYNIDEMVIFEATPTLTIERSVLNHIKEATKRGERRH